MNIDPYIWGILSIFMTCISGTIYLYSVFKGRTKPHVFTWVIWALLTTIAFLIQYTEGAGAGSWATAISAFFCIVTSIACYWHGERRITRFDWIVFWLSLTAIPLWVITKNPTWSIILVTAIDVAAYLPTVRKAWSKPHEEMTFGTHLSNFKHVISLLAMNAFTFNTTLYPIALIVANTASVAVIYYRRYILRPR